MVDEKATASKASGDARMAADIGAATGIDDGHKAAKATEAAKKIVVRPAALS